MEASPVDAQGVGSEEIELSTEHFEGRREDLRLVSGQGLYTADNYLPGQAAGYFLRADRAHARILNVDVSAALEAPGVIGILTGADVAESGFQSPKAINFFKGVGGTSLVEPFRSALARDRVRFVGEPVVLIVAESDYEAQDAAELISIDYEDLPPVIDVNDAVADGAELVHEDVPGNRAFEYSYGDRAAAEQAFESAAHVVEMSLNNERIAGNPMEPKSCLANYSKADGSFDVYVPSQGVSDLRHSLAHVTGLNHDQLRVHSVDVGGAFGVRNEIYPEFVAVMLASRQFGRPVKWTGTRSETIASDHHGRAAKMKGRLALDNDGRFLGLSVEWYINMGAYCSNAGALINTIAAPTLMATSIYKVPAVFGLHHLVFTNTTPTTAYRGAARPNVAYLWERLIDNAADVLGIDRIELRRRNLLTQDQFPFKTLTGSLYDSADPVGLLDTALNEADWSGFEKRRLQSEQNGKLRGIGCATFLEPSGGPGQEEIRIVVQKDGRLGLFANAGPSGQGHETVFPALVADVLGLPADQIDLRYNDVASPVLAGTGSFGSRSLMSHGSALSRGAHELIAKARDLAASELEVSAADLSFEQGEFRVTGTDVSISLRTLIAKFAAESQHPLDTQLAIDTAATYPSAAHIAEVEIDRDTGKIEILRYIAVDDCGAIYNHVLVDGQLQGGLMQGIGQVLGEQIAYDPETGQLLSGTFMDYFMPRAGALPELRLVDRPVVSPLNVLGAKGAGEAGATGAVPAITNAVLHALSPLGIQHLDMPLTPSRVWQAMRERAPQS